MRIVNTKRWLVPPTKGYAFRIGRSIYRCQFTLGNFALITFLENM